MKRTTLFYLSMMILATSALYSCGDDEAAENQSLLIGTWIATDRILQCENAEPITEELDCTDQTCIQYLFRVDTLKRKIYIKEFTSNGVTESEFGTFSVSESSVSFCQEEDGVKNCTSADLNISRTELQLSTRLEDNGCRETIIFFKDSSQ